ncbi:hypothetical protein [Paractinoplanes atraurantiacus]|uniref:hypothetical protein n=1 Tax=Paractinoplanes atraurantiacus TaxID=1036182 RepID=UPI001FEBEBCB|nr:hypothetical protein [Actinoplanes atraurantiacus]
MTAGNSLGGTIAGLHQLIAEHGEFRLEIVAGPDPDSPSAVVWFRADGIAAAIAQGRRFLAVADGSDDRYGELYQRNGDLADFLTTIHLGA